MDQQFVEYPVILSTQDVVEILGISKSTLFRWEREGVIQKVERDRRGERQYDDRLIKAIVEVLLAKTMANMALCPGKSDPERMAALKSRIEYLNILKGDIRERRAVTIDSNLIDSKVNLY